MGIKKFIATQLKRPYIEIISEGGNTKDGFSLELDWNDEFIYELEKAGIEGEDEEAMVRIWLERIMKATDIEIRETELQELAKKFEEDNI